MHWKQSSAAVEFKAVAAVGELGFVPRAAGNGFNPACRAPACREPSVGCPVEGTQCRVWYPGYPVEGGGRLEWRRTIYNSMEHSGQQQRATATAASQTVELLGNTSESMRNDGV